MVPKGCWCQDFLGLRIPHTSSLGVGLGTTIRSARGASRPMDSQLDRGRDPQGRASSRIVTRVLTQDRFPQDDVAPGGMGRSDTPLNRIGDFFIQRWTLFAPSGSTVRAEGSRAALLRPSAGAEAVRRADRKGRCGKEIAGKTGPVMGPAKNRQLCLRPV
jgi:hypothetical protein